ncbi:hypothetical protein [Streptomyces sp. NRRL F-5755]|uniref:hypothetical protein n=1 Tax=Streptomyces sp. NRRL F-5755 TaxID=1519475 RepID=UPI000AF6AE8D|nr:hypothetical protein [Streptomyces sp. NRRL F-5755]
MAAGRRGRRWLPSGRVLGIVATALAVLAGGGWLAKPLWQPWWYAATVCGGHLSGEDLAGLLPDKRLQPADDTFGSGSGVLRCGVNTNDGRRYVLKIEAQTDTGTAQGPLATEFTIPRKPHYAFPKTIPGYYGEVGPVIIQECPGLGRDSDGRARRLVTKVNALGAESAPSPQSLRTAVNAANGAASELGCGAAPLPLPDRVEPIRKLAPSQAEGTMCGWLGRIALPRSPSGRGWKVVAPTDERAPITNCSLLDAGTGEPAVDLTGWYGSWTDKPFDTLLSANVKVPKGHSSHDALLSENFGRAKARCAGESANFLAASYAPHTMRSVLPMSQVRYLLNEFAKDQTERRSCTGLELPDPTVHPNAR